MLDTLRRQIARFLDSRQVGMLSARGAGEPWALPVRYARDGLDIICRLPAWVDPFAQGESDPFVRLVIPKVLDEPNTWLEYDGSAELLEALEAPSRALFPQAFPGKQPGYLLLRIRPRRISIVDETRGWGFRETLDL